MLGPNTEPVLDKTGWRSFEALKRLFIQTNLWSIFKSARHRQQQM